MSLGGVHVLEYRSKEGGGVGSTQLPNSVLCYDGHCGAAGEGPGERRFLTALSPYGSLNSSVCIAQLFPMYRSIGRTLPAGEGPGERPWRWFQHGVCTLAGTVASLVLELELPLNLT